MRESSNSTDIGTPGAPYPPFGGDEPAGGWGAFLEGLVVALVLATLVAYLAWYAHDHPHVATAPVLSPAAAGIQPGQALPDLDPNGDPVWLPIPALSASPMAAPLPQGLYAGTTGVSLSPTEATNVLSTVWRLRTQALRNDQESLLAAIESGPALEADLGAVTSGSSIPTGGFTTSSVIVPAQVGWPRDFLAEAMTRYAGSSWTEILVVERTSPAQPWKVVLASGFANSGTPEFAQPAGAGVNAGTRSGEAALPATLAADWQAATDSGDTATDFASGTWSTERETALAGHRQGELAVNGLVGHYLYQAGSADESFTFATLGSTLSCGVVRVQETWTPPPGQTTIVQDAARDAWGPAVPPGRYRAVVETRIAQPCFVTTSSASAVAVLGGQTSIASLVAVP